MSMKKQWQKLRQLIAETGLQGHDYLALLNEEGEVLCCNAKLNKKFGFKTEGGPQSFYGIIHPADWDSLYKAITTAKTKPAPVTTGLVVKNGNDTTVSWQISYLCGDNGRAEFFISGKITECATQYPDRKKEVKHNSIILLHNSSGSLINIFPSATAQGNNITQLWNASSEVRNTRGGVVTQDELPFLRVLQTGKAHAEVLVIREAGSPFRRLHFSAEPLFCANGKNIEQVITVVTEIQQPAPEANRTADVPNMANRIMADSPFPFWIMDKDNVLLYANKAFFSFFKADEEYSLNKTIIELLPLTVSKLFYGNSFGGNTTGRKNAATEVVHADGSGKHELLVSFFTTGSDGGMPLTVCAATDLTGKIAQDKKIKEAYDRLLFIGRATNDAIWEWDMITGHTYRNDVLMDMIGYHMEKPSGIAWWLRRIHPEDRTRVEENIKNCTDENMLSWQDEYRFKCAGGEYKFIRDKGFIIYENGLPVKMIGSLQDVSGFKELEQELLAEKLQRQQEISETVIKAQENERTLIGNELHDNVNQLLSTARLFVGLLTPETEEEKSIREKSMEYIMTAIDEIRKLSKELVMPRLKDEGLVHCVEALLDDLQATTGIRTKFVFDAEVDLLSPGKKVALFRIIQEQVKNITKYSQAKNVDMLLQKSHDKILLSVKDDGVGFDMTVNREGIGLFNISERVKFYSGTTEVVSAPGEGCALTILIPFGEPVIELAQTAATG
jgi:PAS domain S-box-containing protein